VESLILVEQLFFRLGIVRVLRYTVHGTDLSALWRVVRAYTLGAPLRVDPVDGYLRGYAFVDRFVRANR